MEVINRTGEKVYKLSRAILLRDASVANTSSYGPATIETIASVHQVTMGADGKAQIGSGELLNVHAMASLVKTLVPEQSIKFMPENVLASGVEGVMWWKKPSTELLWFNTNVENDGIGAKCGKVPLPGLVFFANEREWYVFAVKGNERPTLDTELFMTPFYNVWAGGKICSGNADLPKTAEIKDIQGYEKGFFSSRFTHVNVHNKKELSKYRGGAGALWKSLLEGKKKTFPQNSLVSIGGLTVEKWLKSVASSKPSSQVAVRGTR